MSEPSYPIASQDPISTVSSGKSRPLALRVVLVIVFVFLGSGILFFARGKKALFGSLDSYLVPRSAPLEEALTLKTQASEESDVTVEVTPKSISPSGVDFTVTFTTHIVDLDFDLLKEAILKTESETISAVSWDGGRGGHHLAGTLKFPALKNESKSLRLTITNVGAAKERVFEWGLN